MSIATSHDGTKIAYDKKGNGPAVVLVDGALTTRSSGSKPELIDMLSAHFSVYSYDRRGRGESGDTVPYAVEREIEDLETLIDEAGGVACCPVRGPLQQRPPMPSERGDSTSRNSPRQTHDVRPTALAPVLTGFFAD